MLIAEKTGAGLVVRVPDDAYFEALRRLDSPRRYRAAMPTIHTWLAIRLQEIGRAEYFEEVDEDVLKRLHEGVGEVSRRIPWDALTLAELQPFLDDPEAYFQRLLASPRLARVERSVRRTMVGVPRGGATPRPIDPTRMYRYEIDARGESRQVLCQVREV